MLNAVFTAGVLHTNADRGSNLNFESHIPENIVDQMDDVRIQDILFLDNKAIRRDSVKHEKK